MSKGSRQRPTDHEKLANNWPWPDPFQRKMEEKRRQEEAERFDLKEVFILSFDEEQAE